MVWTSGWRKDHWVDLHRVILPSGNEAVFTRPAEWMNAEQVRKYGLHVATRFAEGWCLIDRSDNSLPSAPPEDTAMFDKLPLLD